MSSRATRQSDWILLLAVVLALVLAAIIASEPIARMVRSWNTPEYNHSYVIPLIAAALFLQKVPSMAAVPCGSLWTGFRLVCVAVAVMLIGSLGALPALAQYGFLLAVIGIATSVLGSRRMLLCWAAFAYLCFAVPLPDLVLNGLSQSLQLLSSAIGVGLLRLAGVSVFLEGNVIDLGSYRLQVVEACSGLRYLFPLMSFGFLIAYVFQAPGWQRLIVFLATIPITVLMNSARIAMVGVLVQEWGIGMAEGFMHYFEGWAIFICCLGALALVVAGLNKAFGPGGSAWARLDLSFPAWRRMPLLAGRSMGGPLLACVVLLAAFAVLERGLDERTEVLPQRVSLLRFPLLHEQWLGREQPMAPEVVQSLRGTDFLMADYLHPEFDLPVNAYIAYYESQRGGASAHSPRSCMPAGGWVIGSLARVEVDAVRGTSAERFAVNRAVIHRGAESRLVYYWFQQRGRRITSEYLVKWFLFWDSLTRNRSDGALIRLTIPMPEDHPISEVEQELRKFVRDFSGILGTYIPD